MQFRNDGSGEDNIIRNRFTAYIKLRIEGKRRDVLRKRAKFVRHEISVDYENCFADMADSKDAMLGSGRDPMTWDNELLSEISKPCGVWTQKKSGNSCRLQ